MIGMEFISFLILLAISVVVSGILHYGFKCYATPVHQLRGNVSKAGATWPLRLRA
jgi:hypothetical protein